MKKHYIFVKYLNFFCTLRDNSGWILKHFTGAAFFNFFSPVRMKLATAECPVNKPAVTSVFEFPRRASFPPFGRAVNHLPAVSCITGPCFIQVQKEQHMSLRVSGNISPSLFKALNCLGRDAEQASEFSLVFPQTFPYNYEIISFNARQLL